MPQDAKASISLWEDFSGFLQDYIWFPISNIKFVNIIDILLLSVLLYMVYKFIRDRHAGRTIIGLGVLLVIYMLVMRIFPDFLNEILYTPEELEIINFR